MFNNGPQSKRFKSSNDLQISVEGTSSNDAPEFGQFGRMMSQVFADQNQYKQNQKRDEVKTNGGAGNVGTSNGVGATDTTGSNKNNSNSTNNEADEFDDEFDDLDWGALADASFEEELKVVETRHLKGINQASQPYNHNNNNKNNIQNNNTNHHNHISTNPPRNYSSNNNNSNGNGHRSSVPAPSTRVASSAQGPYNGQPNQSVERNNISVRSTAASRTYHSTSAAAARPVQTKNGLGTAKHTLSSLNPLASSGCGGNSVGQNAAMAQGSRLSNNVNRSTVTMHSSIDPKQQQQQQGGTGVVGKGGVVVDNGSVPAANGAGSGGKSALDAKIEELTYELYGKSGEVKNLRSNMAKLEQTVADLREQSVAKEKIMKSALEEKSSQLEAEVKRLKTTLQFKEKELQGAQNNRLLLEHDMKKMQKDMDVLKQNQQMSASASAYSQMNPQFGGDDAMDFSMHSSNKENQRTFGSRNDDSGNKRKGTLPACNFGYGNYSGDLCSGNASPEGMGGGKSGSVGQRSDQGVTCIPDTAVVNREQSFTEKKKKRRSVQGVEKKTIATQVTIDLPSLNNEGKKDYNDGDWNEEGSQMFSSLRYRLLVKDLLCLTHLIDESDEIFERNSVLKHSNSVGDLLQSMVARRKELPKDWKPSCAFKLQDKFLHCVIDQLLDPATASEVNALAGGSQKDLIQILCSLDDRNTQINAVGGSSMVVKRDLERGVITALLSVAVEVVLAEYFVCYQQQDVLSSDTALLHGLRVLRIVLSRDTKSCHLASLCCIEKSPTCFKPGDNYVFAQKFSEAQRSASIRDVTERGAVDLKDIACAMEKLNVGDKGCAEGIGENLMKCLLNPRVNLKGLIGKSKPNTKPNASARKVDMPNVRKYDTIHGDRGVDSENDHGLVHIIADNWKKTMDELQDHRWMVSQEKSNSLQPGVHLVSSFLHSERSSRIEINRALYLLNRMFEEISIVASVSRVLSCYSLLWLNKKLRPCLKHPLFCSLLGPSAEKKLLAGVHSRCIGLNDQTILVTSIRLHCKKIRSALFELVFALCRFEKSVIPLLESIYLGKSDISRPCEENSDRGCLLLALCNLLNEHVSGTLLHCVGESNEQEGRTEMMEKPLDFSAFYCCTNLISLLLGTLTSPSCLAVPAWDIYAGLEDCEERIRSRELDLKRFVCFLYSSNCCCAANLFPSLLAVIEYALKQVDSLVEVLLPCVHSASRTNKDDKKKKSKSFISACPTEKKLSDIIMYLKVVAGAISSFSSVCMDDDDSSAISHRLHSIFKQHQLELLALANRLTRSSLRWGTTMRQWKSEHMKEFIDGENDINERRKSFEGERLAHSKGNEKSNGDISSDVNGTKFSGVYRKAILVERALSANKEVETLTFELIDMIFPGVELQLDDANEWVTDNPESQRSQSQQSSSFR
eukprot:Nk52_evm7s294 gene=Nk52_evmTU7s294